MKKVWVEAGGKSPNIVLEDAHDLDKITSIRLRTFSNQAEMCSANTRRQLNITHISHFYRFSHI